MVIRREWLFGALLALVGPVCLGQEAQHARFVLRSLHQLNATALPSEQHFRVQSEPAFVGSLLIRAYQECLSKQDRPVCVFSLSCSRFAMQAVQKQGIVTGTLLAADRLQRCNDYAHPYYMVDPSTDKLRDPIAESFLGK